MYKLCTFQEVDAFRARALYGPPTLQDCDKLGHSIPQDFCASFESVHVEMGRKGKTCTAEDFLSEFSFRQDLFWLKSSRFTFALQPLSKGLMSTLH